MNKITESLSQERLEQRNNYELKAFTYTKGASSGALFALNTINPHEITPRINLYIVVLCRGSNPNFRIIKPKRIQTTKSVSKQNGMEMTPIYN